MTKVIRVVDRAELERRKQSANKQENKWRKKEDKRRRTEPLKVTLGDLLKATEKDRATP